MGVEENGTILLVDDVRSSREILKSVFQDEYNILEADNGISALDTLYKNVEEISIVLLDIVMPKMNGFEVLEVLHNSNMLSRIPVVLITADNTLKNKKQGHDLGASDVIGKTFDPYVMKRRVQNIVELYKHKNKLESLVAKQTEELRMQTKKMAEINHQMIDALSNIIEYRSLESGQHIKRIRFFTKTLLTKMCKIESGISLTDKQIDIISDASALHDVGKIAIPDSVLLKPGKLTDSEYEIMKTHSLRGCDIIKNFGRIDNEEYIHYCYDICRYHHERYDGKGYPDGLKGSAIPLSAQVVSIADVYDALVNKRVYKDAYSHLQAVKMIVGGECGTFSPTLLEGFIEASSEFKELADCYADNDQILYSRG